MARPHQHVSELYHSLLYPFLPCEVALIYAVLMQQGARLLCRQLNIPAGTSCGWLSSPLSALNPATEHCFWCQFKVLIFKNKT